MFRLKVLTSTAVAVGMGVAALAIAQPPGDPRRGADEKRNPAGEKRGSIPSNPVRGEEPRRGPEGPARGPEKPDPAVEAWVKVLTEKMNDPHDTVRDSVRAALVAVGAQAIPALQKLADGDDAAKATAARRLIATIERGPVGFPGGAGDPRGPGFPGRPGANPPFPGEPPVPGRPGIGREDPNRPAPEAGRGNPAERILTELNLTEKQREQINDLRAKAQKTLQETMEKARAGQIDREAIRETVDRLHDDFAKAAKAVLTAEQQKKLEDLIPGGRLPLGPPPGAGREGRPDAPPPPQGERPNVRPPERNVPPPPERPRERP